MLERTQMPDAKIDEAAKETPGLLEALSNVTEHLERSTAALDRSTAACERLEAKIDGFAADLEAHKTETDSKLRAIATRIDGSKPPPAGAPPLVRVLEGIA